MSMWGWVLLASAICFGFKLAGNVVPAHVLTNPRFSRVAGLVTAGLLAAMVIVQTFDGGQRIILDARVAALACAAIALVLRAPFIVVVIVGAVAAAARRRPLRRPPPRT